MIPGCQHSSLPSSDLWIVLLPLELFLTLLQRQTEILELSDRHVGDNERQGPPALPCAPPFSSPKCADICELEPGAAVLKRSWQESDVQPGASPVTGVNLQRERRSPHFRPSPLFHTSQQRCLGPG